MKLDGRHITRVHGNREHVASQGYACEKAQRIDYYQNGRDRLTAPMRRRPDGSFEEIDWDTAIREVAAGFKRVREKWGGASIFYYGGGGQGNHLVRQLRRLDAPRARIGVQLERAGAGEDRRVLGRSPALRNRAQRQLPAGRGRGVRRQEPMAVAWLSARATHLARIAADPNRALVVIDPRRTETAEMADYHLRVRPGTDAFCLAAILGVLVQEDLISHEYIRDRTQNSDELIAALNEVPVADYCGRAGVDETLVREVARRIARASSVSVYEDLGIEQSLHSTLNSYLEKLLFAVTGNVGKAGGMNAGTSLTGMFGGALSSQTSPVGGHRIIGGMIPANVIPDEILTDHPKRFRAMLVESENPAHSVADSARMREALRALEFVVVIDVAMTETAREAHYVLPASSQYEKWEATFFGAAFHTETEFANTFTLRAPILEAIPGTLPEGEIHRRLVRALGAMTDDDVAPLRAAAEKGRSEYAMELMRLVSERPQLAE